MGFLAMILGPLMRMLYQMIPNFAVTMIVFTVINKLLMLPLMIKQQKSMAKMSVFTPMINEIQQKYKNNQEKMQEEMLKFQQEYGYSPTAGCGGLPDPHLPPDGRGGVHLYRRQKGRSYHSAC